METITINKCLKTIKRPQKTNHSSDFITKRVSSNQFFFKLKRGFRLCLFILFKMSFLLNFYINRILDLLDVIFISFNEFEIYLTLNVNNQYIYVYIFYFFMETNIWLARLSYALSTAGQSFLNKKYIFDFTHFNYLENLRRQV